jgi:mRNA interferase YafQ
MLNAERTNAFKKSYARCVKRGYDMNALKEVMTLLTYQETLPKRYRNHKLKGQFADCWECHVKPDWLLLYRYEPQTIIFENTGTHSDLF